MSAEELVGQVAVTMLDVDKVEAQLPGENCRAVEGFDDGADLRIGEQRVARGQPLPSVENWMVMNDERLWPIIGIWPAVASRMGQLESDEQPIFRASRLAMSFDQGR